MLYKIQASSTTCRALSDVFPSHQSKGDLPSTKCSKLLNLCISSPSFFYFLYMYFFGVFFLLYSFYTNLDGAEEAAFLSFVLLESFSMRSMLPIKNSWKRCQGH